MTVRFHWSAQTLALAVFLGSFLGYLGILPYRIDQLRPLSVDVPAPTGDEPYYLEMAQSLLRHGTVELTVAHDQLEEFLAFYPEYLPDHRAAGPRGHVSKHFPGLSVFIAPAYWLGDALGGGQYGAARFGVTVLLAAVSAFLVVNLLLLCRELGAGDGWAVVAAVFLGFTSPLLSYSFLIFPEVTAGLLVLYAFRTIRSGDLSRRWALASLAVAALPWLHPRFLALSIPLALLLVFRARRSPTRAAALVALGLADGLAFAAYDLWAFGTVLPNTGDHAGFSDVAGTVHGLVGLFFDQQWGLLVYNPALLLAFIGVTRIVMWDRVGPDSAPVGLRRDLALACAVALPYVLVVAAYRQWWGEWGPPARYLTPVVPLLGVALAASRPWTVFAQAFAVALAAPSLAVAGLFVLWPRAMYNHPTGEAELFFRLAGLGLPNLSPLLPSLVAPTDLTWSLTVGWLLITASVLMLLGLPIVTAIARSGSSPVDQ